VYGQDTIQLRMMLGVLEEQLGAECRLISDIEHCNESVYENAEIVILLFDCSYEPPRRLLERLPDLAPFPDYVVPAFFNVEPDDPTESEAVRRGIRGIFYIDDDTFTVEKGLSLMIEGEVWVSRRVLLQTVVSSGGGYASQRDSAEREQLTRRETEILAMICVGASNDDIADKLYISTNTVKTHIYNIYKKIHVPNRTQAALWAAKNL
jgi:DNA-binding NarL/FixJ family response regulator